VAFSTKIYCKFTAGCACKRIFKISQHLAKLQARKLIASGSQCLGTVLLKDEELARYLEYRKKQLLLTVLTLILT